MTPIQLLLFLFLILIIFIYIRRLGSQLLDRFLLLSTGLMGMILIARPDLATSVANALGVGRGADLLLYFGFLAAIYVWLGISARLRIIESQVTVLVRHISLMEAHSFSEDVASRNNVNKEL